MSEMRYVKIDGDWRRNAFNCVCPAFMNRNIFSYQEVGAIVDATVEKTRRDTIQACLEALPTRCNDSQDRAGYKDALDAVREAIEKLKD